MLTEPDFQSPNPDPSPDLKSDQEPGGSSWSWPPAGPQPAPQPRRARRIPNLGHAILFLIIAAVVVFFTQAIGYSFVTSAHLFPHEAAEQIMRDPRLLIPSMAIGYLITLLAAWAFFSAIWRLPFLLGVRWGGGRAARFFYLFVIVGVVVSILVQLLSNYLPIPKTLPIDKFFRTTTDVWIIAIFGTFIAPVFEETAFRGFLFPALASSWDWLVSRGRQQLQTPPAQDPHWSAGAIVFSTVLTSIGFATLHSSQLAHSWAPLAVLFGVSIILCMVRLVSHSLAASAIVHASYNAAIFTLLYFASGGFHHLNHLAS